MSDSQLPAPVDPSGPLTPADAPMTPDQRWQLIRAMARFQLKLLVDGLKDIMLGPLSLVAGAFDLARGTSVSESWFHAVLRSGARFEAWVNLFEEPNHARAPASAPTDLDAHLRQLEQLLIDQHARGGITASAKQAIDRALDLVESQSTRVASAARTSLEHTEPPAARPPDTPSASEHP